jgi:hypothetical protein
MMDPDSNCNHAENRYRQRTKLHISERLVH